MWSHMLVLNLWHVIMQPFSQFLVGKGVTKPIQYSVPYLPD